jgi:hypothetical protein
VSTNLAAGMTRNAELRGINRQELITYLFGS